MSARSTKPIQRSPIRKRPRKRQRGDDEAYKAWIGRLPCRICFAKWYDHGWLPLFASGEEMPLPPLQKSRTEVAHVGLSTSVRGLSRRYADRETAPLCVAHHREGPESIHQFDGGPDAFFEHHGVSRDGMILELQRVYDERAVTLAG